jgi:hypothetical protein
MARLALTLFVLAVVAAGAWAAEEPVRCSDFLAQSEQLNAQALFRGAAPCVAEKRSFDATLLQIEGQIRAIVDLASLTAKTDEDKMLGAKLYGQIFYSTGGAGDREIYRNRDLTQKLFDQIEAWAPILSADYDPGWRYRRSPGMSEYNNSIKYQKLVRLAQLRWYALLERNDEYYSAESELAEIQKRNPRGIVAGTGDYERVQQLSEMMRRVSDKVGKPDLPPEPPFSFVPDPDADFKQLYVGFNGPEHPGVTIFDNRQDATGSWLSSAMEPSDLASVLTQVNFDSQILVAFAVGERVSATGRFFVTDASYNGLLHSLIVNGAVGVNADDCKIRHVKSFPFAVVVAKRPPVIPKFPGYGLSNFSDGCNPPRAGSSTASTPVP